MWNQWIHSFAYDDKVHALAILLVLDFVLGIIAAFKLGIFRLSYISDFLRNDLLFKVVPYFALYVAALVAGNDSIIINGITWGVVAGAAFVVVLAALAGSLFSSLNDLGLLGTLGAKVKSMLAGSENAAPPKD